MEMAGQNAIDATWRGPCNVHAAATKRQAGTAATVESKAQTSGSPTGGVSQTAI